MLKYEKEGKVAVLYSPGFGAGWSTWMSNDEKAIFCPRLAEALDKNTPYTDLLQIAKEEFPNEYLGGLEDLEIRWIPKGIYFEITEYDGNEKVWVFGDIAGFVA